MEVILKGRDTRLHRIGVDLDDYDLITHADFKTDVYPYRFVEELVDYTGYTAAPLYEYITIIEATSPVNVVKFDKLSATLKTTKIEINGVSDSLKSYYALGTQVDGAPEFGMYLGIGEQKYSDDYDYGVFVGTDDASAVWAGIGGTKDSIGLNSQITTDMLCVVSVGQALELYVGKYEDEARVRVKIYKKTLVTEEVTL